MRLDLVYLFIFSFLLIPILSAQTVLGPGESLRVTCSNSGGGGGNAPTCVQQLSDWCYSFTSYSSTVCFQKSSAYCPAVSYSSCVKSTAEYCYAQTSLSRDQCFEQALGTCRGNLDSIQSLMQSVSLGATLKEKGLDLQQLKLNDSELSNKKQ